MNKISTMRTYKILINGDETLNNLYSFVNQAAEQATRKLMLAEQATNRDWRWTNIDYPQFDTISELKKLYPLVNPIDVKALWNYCVEKEFDEVQLCGVFSGSATKDLGIFSEPYKKLVEVGFLPLFTLHTINKVNRSVYNALCRRLGSFIKCDKLTQSVHKNLKEELENSFNDIDPIDAQNINDFLEFSQKTFNTKDENIGHFLSDKFRVFLKYVYKEDIDLSIGRYSYVNQDGEKRRIYYTANVDIMKFINSRNGLCKALVNHYDIVEKYDEIKRHKITSRITIPSETHSPIDLHFGCNYIDQKFEEKNGEYFLSDISNKLFPNPYKLYYKKQSGVYQLMNLKLVQALRTESGKGSKTDTPTRYKISFDVNGKQHREGYIKEFSIQRREGKYILNLTFGDSFYSPLTSIFSSGIEKASTKKNQDVIKEAIKKDGCIRALGVDLGMNPCFGWSVVESYDSLGKNTAIIKSGKEGETNNKSEFMTLFYSFLDANKALRRMLTLCKHHIDDKKPIDDETLEDIKEYSSYIDTNEVLNMLKDSSKPLTEIKSTWCLRKLRKHIMNIFGKMKEYRRHHNQTTTPNEAIYMIIAINDYIRILTKYNKVGYFNPDKTSHVDTFKDLWEYRDNLLDDALKKLSYSIVSKAVENKCHFIAVENLEMLFKDKKGTLSNVFAHGEFKNKIEQIAAMNNMPVVEVDSTATSQIHPITGEWGYRKLDEFDGDFISSTGEKLDSDGYVAGSNIAKRALCFHTDLKILSVKGDGINWIPRSEGVRIAGMLGIKKTDSFQFIDGKIQINSGVVAPDNFKTQLQYYFHNGKWIIKKEHDDILQSIKLRAVK